MFEINEKEGLDFLKLFGINPDGLNNFLPNVTDSTVPLSALGIAPRVFFHWKEMGLVDFNQDPTDASRQWVKMNLIEVVWLKIVIALRDFGLPIKEIIKIKGINKSLIEQIPEHELAIIKNFEESGAGKDIIDSVKTFIKLYKTNPGILNDKYIKLGTPLGAIMSEILLMGSYISFLFYKDNGEINMDIKGYSGKPLPEDMYQQIITQPHIVIPINELLSDFITVDKNEKYIEQFGLISPDEKEILQAIRNKKVKEIILRKDNHEKITMTTTSKGELKDDKVKMIKRLLGMDDYDDIRLVLRNDKHIFLECKKKRKL